MKTKEEIEQLAKEEYKDDLHNPFFTAAPMGFIKGYSQCQEDMAKDVEYWQGEFDHWHQQAMEMAEYVADKKYTEADMLNCWNTLMVAMTNHNPIFFKDYINSLNKQD